MSSQQQERREEDGIIKCEDLFSIQGHRDAAMMQAADIIMMGDIRKSDAAKSDSAVLFGRNDSVKGTDTQGRRVISESIAGQMVGQYNQKGLTSSASFQQGNSGNASGGITIGEALEATALTAGQKPVEWSDAAAIQAAEVRATGRTTISPGGVAAAAQSAATLNARTARDEDKTKLADILSDATSKLTADRPATRKDAEGVTGAEMRNDPYLTTHPAGVAASIAAAARLNQQNNLK
ncbi:late embryogenesis abundant protein 47-like isoform X1 [Mercurialis annua]|uniref:late embryogenesis abundant protein 47-like isoform X1 n=1 Tax=Mercurialis annua TaxID=3986 RepID=UPI0021607582|nr:late embryogenesis abundant protein 47-like isoform X1 [Mercurialis annua]